MDDPGQLTEGTVDHGSDTRADTDLVHFPFSGRLPSKKAVAACRLDVMLALAVALVFARSRPGLNPSAQTA
jgi:hypothetical protein